MNNDHIESKQNLLGGQCIMILCLIGAWIGLKVIGYFFPSFFPYSYLKWGGWQSVWRFWPLFVWGTLLVIIGNVLDMGSFSMVDPKDRNPNFVLGLITSVLAGVWEELGYRYVFICYGMIGILSLNWFLGVGIGWAIIIAIAVFAIYLWTEDEGMSAAIVGVLALALSCALYRYGGKINLVYWFNDLIRYGAHLLTLGKVDSILYGSNGRLFILGAIAANAWFRDGHKYQGWFGWVNSWYAGMILLYATMTFGLMTAIVVHALYDIIFDVVTYVASHIDEAT